ncbi:hypothetical protein SAY87_029677 [Trapa incisa]|uniref:Uncharacterized protein n=1 Tax=Trapa incisa TaxID=236973 RepID=A0AAN7Q9A4_9MYRT|nr:hypothetical protein SAY87_029677 [Trapa incisa]
MTEPLPLGGHFSSNSSKGSASSFNSSTFLVFKGGSWGMSNSRFSSVAALQVFLSSSTIHVLFDSFLKRCQKVRTEEGGGVHVRPPEARYVDIRQGGLVGECWSFRGSPRRHLELRRWKIF